jgi:WXXGXW repeat (2 copies)
MMLERRGPPGRYPSGLAAPSAEEPLMTTARFAFALLLALGLVAAAPAARAQVAVGVSINIAPPLIPVYAQPPLPGPGYMWTPGYWAWGPSGYYWVPGTWVLPPAVGVLWTPGYWGWRDGFYVWHAGYWGPHVGFYGGVNYGFGYGGVGFHGGHWDHGGYFYNRSVTNFGGAHITNVYNERVVVNERGNRVAYNGGPGGRGEHPGAREVEADREAHHGFTDLQAQHERAAGGNRAAFATENHGRPPVAGTRTAGHFDGPGITPARGGGHGPQNHPGGPGGKPPGGHHDDHHDEHHDEHH